MRAGSPQPVGLQIGLSTLKGHGYAIARSKGGANLSGEDNYMALDMEGEGHYVG
jgi:hypothetical protein